MLDSDRPMALLATQIRWWGLDSAESGRKRIILSGMRLRKKQDEQKIQSGKRRWSCSIRPNKPRSGHNIIDLQNHRRKCNTQLYGIGVMYFKFPILLLRMLCGYFAHQRRISFECCTSALAQTYTAVLPGTKFGVVLLRLVLQDALWAVFDVYPEVRIESYVDEKNNTKSTSGKTRKRRIEDRLKQLVSERRRHRREFLL